MNYLISATDTDAGKTFVTGILLAMLNRDGQRAVGFKPIASGAVRTADGAVISEDASFLLAMAGLSESFRPRINPYTLEPALAPDLAAEVSGISTSPDVMEAAYRRLAEEFDRVLVEGAGGITTGLAKQYTVVDMAHRLQLPLILVCDNRLGAINRILTTIYYCRGHDLTVRAIIINGSDDPHSLLEKSNRRTMQARSGVPVIGSLPIYTGRRTREALATWAAPYLDIAALS